jgi:PAS domain S-box-containing protein
MQVRRPAEELMALGEEMPAPDAAVGVAVPVTSDRSRQLAEAAVAITRATSLAEVLAMVTEQASSLIGAHQAVTSLTVGDDWSQSISHVTLSEKYAAWRDYASQPDGSGIYAWVCRENRPMRLTQAELEAHPLWRGFGREAAAHPPMAGWLAAPLIGRDGGNIGLIQLSDKRQGEFDDRDEATLVQFAQMAAAAVENVRLRDELAEAHRRERERAEELEALMAALPAAVWIAHDPKAERITGSRASYDLLRLPYGVNASKAAPDAPVSHFTVMANGRELRPEELPVQVAALEGRDVPDFEEQIVFDDGEVRHLFGNATPLRDFEGRVRGSIAAFVDVTALREAERQLRENEERTRLALAATGMGTWEVNVVTQEARASADVGPLYGMPPGFAHSSTAAWLEMVHPEDRGRVADARRRLFENGDPYEEEFRVMRPDGTLRWLHSRATLFRDADQRPWKAVGVVSDVTARKRVEEALLASEERYRFLANSVPVMVWTARADGQIDFVNERWEDYFGLDANHVQPDDWAARIHPDDVDRVEAEWQLCVRTRREFVIEYRLRRRDGVYRWHLCLARPQWIDGELHSWVGSIVDVQEQKAKEATLQFLVDLNETTRTLSDPNEAMRTIARMLGKHLGVNRCAYAEVDPDESHFTITGDYVSDTFSIVGRYPLPTFGDEALMAMREGRTYVASDVEASPEEVDLDAYRQAEIRAVICVPLHKGGRFVAAMAVHCRAPREWTADEIHLVEMVVDRCWSTLERTRAEREIRRGTTRYRALAEAAASVVFAADAEGRLTDLPFLRGLDPSVARTGLGGGWLLAVHPDDRPAAIAAWHAAVAAGDPYDTEFRIRMAGGDYRWHVARGVRVNNEFGEPSGWIGACVDVHDRVTTDRTLRLVNELTAATRDSRNPDEVIVHAQRLLGQRLGATRCAYGEPASGGRRFVGPPNYCVGCEDLSRRFPITGFNSSTSEALRAGKTLIIHDVAAEMTPEAGRDAFLATSIAAALCVPVLKEGRLVAILGVHQDRPRTWTSDEIELARNVAERTWSELERVRAEHAVQRSEQRLRQTLEAATVGVALNDVSGQFLYANRPMLRLLGYTEADLWNGLISWNAIQAPDRRAQDDLALDQLRKTGTCDPYETEFVTQDGRRVPVYVGAALVPDAEGQGNLGAAFVTDLSALKEAERELVRLNADLERRVRERTSELEAANREMEGFTYTVAHDLRAPLRAIISTARILQSETADVLSEEHLGLLERQAQNATHLARLLDDLLVNARIARQEVRRLQIDLSDLVERVADAVREERPNPILVEPGLHADADPNLLRLAIQNLLDNACKFSPDGAAVAFGRADTERGPAYFVRDHGVGFDMTHAGKLFEPFVRLVRQDEFPGTGIGLANVKRVVERHGGDIWVESEPGQGTTFWFTLGGDPAGVS